MNESQQAVGDLCEQIRRILEVNCNEVMAKFEEMQLPDHHVEYAIVTYMLDGEEAITMSASAAPWMMIVQALRHAAKNTDAKTERLQ